MPKLLGFFLGFTLFLITAKSAFAVTVTISDYPETISQDPFAVTVSVEGAQTATNYLRLDLYKEGTTNYFGETHNGTEWYSGSDGKQYFPINVQSGQVWTGQVQARIGEPSSSEYSGPGDYKMRIRRYTASGGQGGENANDSSVSTTINTPAPSPSPNPSPTSSSSSQTSSSSPSKSPSPTPKSSGTQSTTASPNQTGTVLSQKSQDLSSTSTSASLNESPSPSPSASPQTQELNSKTKIAGVLVGSGVILIGLSAGFYLWYKRVLGAPDEENKEGNS